MIYTVYKVCSKDSRQLLLIKQPDQDAFSLSVYDEHSGTTLMRMTEPVTVDLLKRAIAILEDGDAV